MTVLERLKELHEWHDNAIRSAEANQCDPGNMVGVSGQSLFGAMRNALPHLIAVAEAAQAFMQDASDVRHIPEHDSDQWAACQRFDESRKPLDAALNELTKGAGDER